MGKITQYSRLSHHTIAGSASAGLTFSVPLQEDFTDGSWTPYDLALSEIGVNEQDKRVFIRIGDTIEELGVIGGSALGTTPSLSQVLTIDNQTLGNDIEITNGDEITGPYIQINGSGGGPLGSSVEIRHIDTVSPLDYIGVFIDDKSTSVHYTENIVGGVYALNGIQLGVPKIEKSIGSTSSNFTLDSDYISLVSNIQNGLYNSIEFTSNLSREGIYLQTANGTSSCGIDLRYRTVVPPLDPNQSNNDVLIYSKDVTNNLRGNVFVSYEKVETKVFDNTSTYLTQIISTTQSTLINTEDLVTPKQGKLEIDRDFAYFGHFNGSTSGLSYIQAQDDTVTIQTQKSGSSTNDIAMDSGSFDSVTVTTTSPAGDIAGVETRFDTFVNKPVVSLFTQDSTASFITNLELSNDSAVLQVSSTRPGSLIEMNLDNINLVSNEYVNSQTVNGSKLTLRNTQQYIGEAQDNTQTTDATPTTGTVIFPDFTPVVLSGTTSCWFEAEVLGFGVTNSLAYGAKLFGVFKRTGGTVTQVSTTDKVEKTDFSKATSDFVISGSNISVQVTGEASTDIDWNMSYRWKIQTQL